MTWTCARCGQIWPNFKIVLACFKSHETVIPLLPAAIRRGQTNGQVR